MKNWFSMKDELEIIASKILLNFFFQEEEASAYS